eukprot:IDg9186t1
MNTATRAPSSLIAQPSMELAHLLAVQKHTAWGKKGDYKPVKVDIGAPGGNLLTPQGLAFLKEAEDVVENRHDYKRFCHDDLKNKNDCNDIRRTCAIPISITSHPLLYGQQDAKKERLCGRRRGSAPVPAAKFSLFKRKMQEDPSKFLSLLGKDFNVTSFTTQTIRSYINFGSPIKNVSGATTEKEKDDAFSKWATDASKELNALSTNQFHVFPFSSTLIGAEFQPQILRDLSFAGI